MSQRLQFTKRALREKGQAIMLVVVVLGIFLLAALAFSADYTKMWFHRQHAQAAADAVCLAGATDMIMSLSGVTGLSPGYTLGSPGNCPPGSATGSLCSYAKFNGYPPSAWNANAPSNFVSWTFPSSVPGVTKTTITSYPYLQVTIKENVKAIFSPLITGNQYQAVQAVSTCGVVQQSEGAPIMVLNPTIKGALYYTGGAALKVVGGPSRSIVVNSNASTSNSQVSGATTAIWCSSSGSIDTSTGGPNFTGSDVGTYGGPMLPPNSGNSQDTCNGTNSTNGLPAGWSGGTTGHWDWPAAPVPDPYSAVPTPANMKNYTPITKRQETNGSNVTMYNLAPYGMDGCPDTSPTNYGSYNDNTYWACSTQYIGQPHYCSGCKEYGPGYYPSGISESGNDVITFLPGVYYMDGNLSIGGSDYIRMAKPCANSQGVVNAQQYPTGNCSPKTYTAGPNGNGGGTPWTRQITDGVMFYFHGSAVPIISGASGSYFSGSRVDTVPVTDLTCDGSTPPSYLGLGSSLNENVLEAVCTSQGTYWDIGGDTTDTVGNIRGLVMFMDHSDTGSPQFQGSGALAYTGTFYFHSSTYATVFQIPGGTTSGTLIWGNIVTDQLQLTGSGLLKMALNPNKTTQLLKAGLFQ